MIPFVRDMWAYGSHFPVYHTDYMFPYTSPSVLTSDGTVRVHGYVHHGVVKMRRQTREKAVLVVRRMFLEAVKSYVYPFLGYTDDRVNEKIQSNSDGNSDGSGSGNGNGSVGFSHSTGVLGKSMPGHSAMWRSGSTAVVLLDLASAWKTSTVENMVECVHASDAHLNTDI